MQHDSSPGFPLSGPRAATARGPVSHSPGTPPMAYPLLIFDNGSGHQPSIPAAQTTVAEDPFSGEKIFSSAIGLKNVIYNCTGKR